MKILKQIIWILLKAGISVVLLWYLFRQLDMSKLLGIIKTADKHLLMLAFSIFIIPYVCAFFRWMMLLDTLNINISAKRILAAFSGGIFFNQILPSSIGGDLMRSMDLAVHTKRAREVVATVFLDRLSGYIGLVLMALAALALGWDLIRDRNVLLTVILITGLLVVVLLVLFNKAIYRVTNRLLHSPVAGKIRDAVTNLHREIHLYRDKWGMMVRNISLSLLLQLSSSIAFYFIARSVGVKISFVYFLIFLPIIGAITMLPISIGGLGLRENAAAYLFPLVGVNKDLAVAMSLLNFSFIVAVAAAGGLVYYVLTVHHRRLQPDKASASGSRG
jgi:uncharacterized protein (TIRG00374 family)